MQGQNFIEHLEELRKRILISLGSVLIGAVLGYFYSEKILRFVLAPIQSQGESLYFFSPADAFILRIKMALLAGFILAFPVITTQIWLFVSPGLYAKERKLILPWILVSFFLFLAGISFCFLLVVPFALKFFMGFGTDFLRPMISVTYYVDFLSTLSLAFGIAFNLPVFLMALVSFGILNAKSLSQYRRHAIVLIFISAAILTPSPDVFSQLMLAIPLLFLFEVSVIGAKIIEFRRKKK